MSVLRKEEPLTTSGPAERETMSGLRSRPSIPQIAARPSP
jgi:hypothetical protein